MHSKALFIPVLLLTAGCSGNAATPSDAGNDAPTADAGPSVEQAFWTAFWAGDLSAGAADIPPLQQAASSSSPPGFYDSLLVGMDATWQLAESGRNPQTAAQIGQTYGPVAGQFLGQAHGINPSDTFTTALLGFTVWNGGVQTNNSAMITQGKGLVDQAYAEKPELGWVLELIMAQFVPVNDPQMQTAITAGWSYFSLCGGTTVDPTNPDLSAYLAQTKTSTRTFCVNDTLAPHMVEGSLLYFGDLLVKSNNPTAAKPFYAAAQSSADFAAWPHKDIVTSRLSSDLTARAASYQGPSSSWPSFAASPYVCGTCHNTQ